MSHPERIVVSRSLRRRWLLDDTKQSWALLCRLWQLHLDRQHPWSVRR